MDCSFSLLLFTGYMPSSEKLLLGAAMAVVVSFSGVYISKLSKW